MSNSRTDGTFILSLDCEGRWGMADQKTDGLLRSISLRAIRGAYERLLSMLEKFEIAATFATVGAFALESDEFRSLRPRLDASPGHRAWMGHVERSIREHPDGAWHLPELAGMIRDGGGHEWSTHGFTHVPFAHVDVTEETCRLELELVVEHSPMPMSTMVFPRNQVARAHLLPQYGITAYREASSHAGRLGRLVREFLPRIAPQEHSDTVPAGEPLRIPSGHLLNWRRSARRLVPPRVTMMRVDSLLSTARARGGVAHVWFHPHNLVTGRGQFELVEQMLGSVARHRAEGLRVMTMGEYAGSLR